jgi:hypothetical protein
MSRAGHTCTHARTHARSLSPSPSHTQRFKSLLLLSILSTKGPTVVALCLADGSRCAAQRLLSGLTRRHRSVAELCDVLVPATRLGERRDVVDRACLARRNRTLARGATQLLLRRAAAAPRRRWRRRAARTQLSTCLLQNSACSKKTGSITRRESCLRV